VSMLLAIHWRDSETVMAGLSFVTVSVSLEKKKKADKRSASGSSKSLSILLW
jgi:hypothetical protein